MSSSFDGDIYTMVAIAFFAFFFILDILLLIFVFIGCIYVFYIILKKNKEKIDFFTLWFKGVFLTKIRGRVYQSLLSVITIISMLYLDNNVALSVMSSMLVALIFNLLCIESYLEYRKIARSKISLLNIDRLFNYNRLIKWVLLMDYANKVDVDDSSFSTLLPKSSYTVDTVKVLTLGFKSPLDEYELSNKISSMIAIDALDLLFQECLSLAAELSNSLDFMDYENVKSQLDFFIIRQRKSLLTNELMRQIDLQNENGSNLTVKSILDSFIIPIETVEFWLRKDAGRYFKYCGYNKNLKRPFSTSAHQHHLRSKNDIRSYINFT